MTLTIVRLRTDYSVKGDVPLTGITPHTLIGCPSAL